MVGLQHLKDKLVQVLGMELCVPMFAQLLQSLNTALIEKLPGSDHWLLFFSVVVLDFLALLCV